MIGSRLFFSHSCLFGNGFVAVMLSRGERNPTTKKHSSVSVEGNGEAVATIW
jgi:hypothetical protein